MTDVPTVDIERIKSKLLLNEIKFVAKRDVPDSNAQPQAVVYFSCSTITNNDFLIELKFKTGTNLCKITVKSRNKNLSELCKMTVSKIIMNP